MPERRPQINFQVDQAMKYLYEEARAQGHWVTRFCAAGLLLMVEDPRARAKAINRLREWEAEYESASPEQVRSFVEGAQDAMRRPAPGSRPAPRARAKKKTAKRR
ncbi:MAG: hypothetical protein PVJ57_02465 [Phycisphaerae bacterium]